MTHIQIALCRLVKELMSVSSLLCFTVAAEGTKVGTIINPDTMKDCHAGQARGEQTCSVNQTQLYSPSK